MNSHLRYFGAAFCIGVILIGTILGFAAVDMSTERYMPGVFPPLLTITPAADGGFTAACMGYTVSSADLLPETLWEQLYRRRGLLPPELLLTGRVLILWNQNAREEAVMGQENALSR